MSESPEKKTNPFAALADSGTTFGGKGGFDFSAPVAAFGSAPKAEEEGEDGPAVEEECQAEFKPIVQLSEVETKSGEEDEDVLVELKCKLYRFDNQTDEWKERGVGQVKLLQHKESKKVRCLMRQDKTLKIRANHLVIPGTKLQEHSGNDKAWVFTTADFADGKMSTELFCIRFGSTEKAAEFKKKYEEAVEINAKLLGVDAEEEDDEAEAPAEAEAEEKKTDEAEPAKEAGEA
eukprot:CAMPEP_0175084008 /NCGR_PEP_ID=MMETSP0052_2-20121109/27764_1 /TAXON_ID=51329 ORGANISM="Polytomella parva, Strain SAG 63-3" /NCGR_SAMPLE_ID=MMETSP0052_2 /ASSEMBLY_ACC=CAM_ASM_000194 /LENGTH=233 /DNA_ID=CAMNT_0016355651 /DNA_START=32 /DNA_END=733 /DNA_ORIENTATION=+